MHEVIGKGADPARSEALHRVIVNSERGVGPCTQRHANELFLGGSPGTQVEMDGWGEDKRKNHGA